MSIGAVVAARRVSLGPASSSFVVLCGSDGAIASLRRAKDAFDTDYIEEGGRLGHVGTAWRRLDGIWQSSIPGMAAANGARDREPVRCGSRSPMAGGLR